MIEKRLKESILKISDPEGLMSNWWPTHGNHFRKTMNSFPDEPNLRRLVARGILLILEMVTKKNYPELCFYVKNEFLGKIEDYHNKKIEMKSSLLTVDHFEKNRLRSELIAEDNALYNSRSRVAKIIYTYVLMANHLSAQNLDKLKKFLIKFGGLEEVSLENFISMEFGIRTSLHLFLDEKKKIDLETILFYIATLDSGELEQFSILDPVAKEPLVDTIKRYYEERGYVIFGNNFDLQTSGSAKEFKIKIIPRRVYNVENAFCCSIYVKSVPKLIKTMQN